ncbi:MAG: FKBP-type peptidyl-prolyl cis-trans isomerase [Armatimonadetes bacterium]|nr:FKBP-type peptidyl-prolyl cis-trans isomerase [Armatimonadota bacterium]MDE2207230.1 FKBP-type peptidyl-prolyl cis-trans isomerase [Armatimonadota bacterium]
MRHRIGTLAVVLGLALLAGVAAAGPGKQAKHKHLAHHKGAKSHGPKMVTLKNGLKYVDLVVGKGAMASAPHVVVVQYIGTLANGTKFDSSYDHGTPFTFGLGQHQVIKGWDIGVAGMRVGGKRKLIVPPSLGYGAEGTPGGPIPPNATLTFVIQLLKIQPLPKAHAGGTHKTGDRFKAPHG